MFCFAVNQEEANIIGSLEGPSDLKAARDKAQKAEGFTSSQEGFGIMGAIFCMYQVLKIAQWEGISHHFFSYCFILFPFLEKIVALKSSLAIWVTLATFLVLVFFYVM